MSPSIGIVVWGIIIQSILLGCGLIVGAGATFLKPMFLGRGVVPG